jgi:hypothetical protein
LKAGAGLAVNLAHGVFQRGQRLQQIGVLRIEILLAFRQLREFLNRRQIDRAQPLNPPLDLLQLRQPVAFDRRFRQVGNTVSGSAASSCRNCSRRFCWRTRASPRPAAVPRSRGAGFRPAAFAAPASLFARFQRGVLRFKLLAGRVQFRFQRQSLFELLGQFVLDGRQRRLTNR